MKNFLNVLPKLDPEMVRQMTSNRESFSDRSHRGFSVVIPLSILGKTINN